MAHVHESPNVMLVPLYVLAIGAVFAGVIFAPYFTGHHFQQFWGDSILILESHTALENAHHVPFWVKATPLVVGLIGIFGAIWVYRGGLERGKSIGRFWGPFYQFSLNKWYFDELYDFLFVRPSFALGRLFWKRGDGDVIDGLGPDGVAKSTSNLAGPNLKMSEASFPLLSLTTFAPLVGALFVMIIRGTPEEVARNARWVAFVASVTTFLLSLLVLANFDGSSADFQLVEYQPWLESVGIGYKMGVDGISIWFVLLSTLLSPLCILASWRSIKVRVREYMIAFLVLETMMVGMFCALDMLLFYIFFEGVLLPMFLIIGVWGGGRRIYAAFKFFLYTLLGSILMLVAIIAMYYSAGGTTDIPTLMTTVFPRDLQMILWLAFFASFAVKVPMWPVHTWLPDAHVEAPTAGSVILAGVLLKMGGYGFLRFSIPMMPLASEAYAPLVFTLSCVAVVYTSLVALVQEDMKKLIAYSSIAHMGFVTAAIFSMNETAIAGSIIQMLSHGLVSGALFLCVGVVYDRLHTREISRYGGLATNMPRYALVFMLFTMASVGLPGTSGFVGEFLILYGAFEHNTYVAAFLATGMILGAAYMLYLYRRVVFGALTKDDVKGMLDMSPREIAIFVPLIILTLWMGIYPSTFLDPIEVSVTNLVENYDAALAAAQSGAALVTGNQ